MNLTKSASLRLRRLIFPTSPVPTPSTLPTPPKTWETSQDYELRHAIAYMNTPKWPIVLANMSRYAAPGCMLLLWTEYNHHGAADDGHYEICEQAADLKRLVEQLGFEILREHADAERFEANWGCVAKKRDTPC
jgi:hypothetical protein